ncbi:MAG: LPS export ABC transporter periplasmic protein LptC, partial [Pyrinomonadaceae bacterium]
MSPADKNLAKQYRLRAAMPKYFKFGMIAALGVALLVVAVGFYRERSKASFRLKGEHAQLSKDVIAEVNGYERLETDNGIKKYYIKADHAKTFSDNHQELQNVYVETYGDESELTNKMSAESAIYIPDADKNFTVYLRNKVSIETSDNLKVATNELVYTRSNEVAEAPEAITFERDNIKGKSTGAVVNVREKRLDLLRDVEIEAFDSPELAKSGVRYAKVNSGSAIFDQAAGKVVFNDGSVINITSTADNVVRSTEIRSSKATGAFEPDAGNSPKLNKFELFDHVRITSTETGKSPTNIESGYALYDRAADQFELKNGAHITTVTGYKATDIRGTEILFAQTAHKVSVTGDAEITQGSDQLKGNSITADLYAGNKVKEAVIRGDASARQNSPERTTLITAPELNASFAESGAMKNANAIGQSNAELIPADAKAYSRVTMASARGIGLSFRGEGLLDAMRTDGRTTINLNVPNDRSDAANKRLTADAVRTTFGTNGKDINRAEAVGNAELYVEPLNSSVQNYRTTVNAPRFDCDFFPTGNNAKLCVGGRKAKAVRVPTVKSEDRGDQILTADQLTAKFNEASKDIEVLDANGSAKFVEFDRNAISKQMVFSQADQTIRLRGGEPTVWDSRARAKATEIDWDTAKNRSFLRGGVSTTYYSRKQMKDSTPFGSSDKPVFATSEEAEFDHAAEKATYSRNARAWQDNNYVRGDQ